jgi:uncharacterized RDD family membrane protein YckC
MTLDTLVEVETPEGIALHLRAAGIFPRAAAWAIDAAIRLVILTVLAMIFGQLGQAGEGLFLLALFAMMWLYPVLFEVLRDGQTIGKKAMGLRVIHANGTPVGWLASSVRNLLRTVDALPFLYGFGLLAGLFDPHSRRLGDMVAGTLVVHADKPRTPLAAPQVPVVASPWPLAAVEQSAIVAYAERMGTLTSERSEELAELLPMLTQAKGGVAVQRLLGIAAACLGRS